LPRANYQVDLSKSFTHFLRVIPGAMDMSKSKGISLVGG
jgi:hypothetical protein